MIVNTVYNSQRTVLGFSLGQSILDGEIGHFWLFGTGFLYVFYDGMQCYLSDSYYNGWSDFIANRVPSASVKATIKKGCGSKNSDYVYIGDNGFLGNPITSLAILNNLYAWLLNPSIQKPNLQIYDYLGRPVPYSVGYLKNDRNTSGVRLFGHFNANQYKFEGVHIYEYLKNSFIYGTSLMSGGYDNSLHANPNDLTLRSIGYRTNLRIPNVYYASDYDFFTKKDAYYNSKISSYDKNSSSVVNLNLSFQLPSLICKNNLGLFDERHELYFKNYKSIIEGYHNAQI